MRFSFPLLSLVLALSLSLHPCPTLSDDLCTEWDLHIDSLTLPYTILSPRRTARKKVERERARAKEARRSRSSDRKPKGKLHGSGSSLKNLFGIGMHGSAVQRRNGRLWLRCAVAREAEARREETLVDVSETCFNDFVFSRAAKVPPIRVRKTASKRGVKLAVSDVSVPVAGAGSRSAVQCSVSLHRRTVAVFRIGAADLAEEGDGLFATPVRSAHPFARPRAAGARHQAHIFARQALARKYAVAGDTVEYLTGFPVGRVRGSLKCARTVSPRKLAVGGARERSSEARAAMDAETVPSFDADAARRCPMVFSHRSVVDGGDQENSIGALRESERAGVSGVEIDVFDSSRGPVVTHDKTLDRQLGISNKIESVVNDQITAALENLTGCDVLKPLDTFLAELAGSSMLVDLDLKPMYPSLTPRAIRLSRRLGSRVGKLVRKHGLADRTVVSSMDAAKLPSVNPRGEAASGRAIRVAHAQHGGLGVVLHKTGEALRTMDKVPEGVPLAEVVEYSVVSKSRVRDAHARGRPIGVYTIFDAQEIDEDGDASGRSHRVNTVRKMIDARVDWIETDNPVKLWNMIYDMCVALPRSKVGSGSSSDDGKSSDEERDSKRI